MTYKSHLILRSSNNNTDLDLSLRATQGVGHGFFPVFSVYCCDLGRDVTEQNICYEGSSEPGLEVLVTVKSGIGVIALCWTVTEFPHS